MYNQIKRDVLVILNDENDYTIDHHEDIDHIKQLICNLELIFVVLIINTQIIKLFEDSNISESEANQKISDIVKEELDINKWFDNIEEVIEKAREIETDLKYFKSQHISEFVSGSRHICIAAVHWTLNTFYKVIKMIDVNLKYLAQYPEESNFKMIFILSSYLSKLFDLVYSAALDNPKDILYSPENKEDIDILMKYVDFSVPKDLVDHRKRTLDGMLVILYNLL